MTAIRFPVDVSAWIGAYPFREIPHPDASVLARVLERERIGQAWVGSLPSVWHRDPGPSNTWLYDQLAAHAAVMLPSPTVRPDWPGWETTLDDAVERGAPSVRLHPMQVGVGSAAPLLASIARACGERGLVLQLTVRFEDLRQRHPMDTAGDLTAAHIRSVVRADPRVHVIASGAGRDLIEETHWSLTPAEQVRCFWDWAWVWGPPEDHFAHLVESIGADRFVFGGHWPLRLIQAPVSTFSLLEAFLPGLTTSSAGDILRTARRMAGR
jgi:predicted TIM-barrel fold metal-dependent hydrolase